MSVAIVDSCPLFRRGLQHSLAKTKLRVSINASSFEQIEDDLTRQSLTLCVLGMSHGWVPILDLLRRIRGICSSVPIAVLSSECNPQQARAAIENGATAIISKNVTCEALVDYLSLVRLGERILPMSFAVNLENGVDSDHSSTAGWEGQRLPPPEISIGLGGLSKREADVLQHLRCGASNKLIAKTLLISEATVKIHVKAVFRKINVKNRTQAAIWANQNLAAGANAQDHMV